MTLAPKARVEIGYGSTWQTEPASITWTDETERVLVSDGIQGRRGASSARGQVDVGTLELVLDNADRRFDPTYTAGPLYGLLVPGVPVRIIAEVVEAVTDGGGTVTDGGAVVWDLVAEVPVWSGTVASWPQRYDRGNTWATVPLQCFDRFDKLSRAKIPRSVLEAEIMADSPVAYWPLDETTGQTMADRSGNGNDGSYVHGTPALSTEVESDDGGFVRGIDFDGSHTGSASVIDAVTARPCTFTAVVRPEPNVSDKYSYVVQGGTGDTRGTFVLAIWDEDSPAGWWVAGAIAGAADDVAVSEIQEYADGFAHVAYRGVSGSAAEVYVNGVNATDITGTSSTVVPSSPGVTVGAFKKAAAGSINGYKGLASHVCLFDSDIGAVRIAAHAAAATAPLDGQTTDERIDWILDEIGWPTNLRALEVGRSILGPATFKPGDGALQYLRLVEDTEDGLLFIGPDGALTFHDRFFRYLETVSTTSQFTFTDQDGDQGYADFQLDLDDELLVNVARYTRRNGTEQVASDATSIAAYGEAEDVRSDLLSTTDAQVRSLAEWAVSTKSTPLPRVPSIRIGLHRYSVTDQETVLGLDLGHRVTVNRTPQGVGDPISLDFIVEGVRHEVAYGQWWVDLFVSPIPQDTVELFLLGTSELGGTHILAH